MGKRAPRKKDKLTPAGWKFLSLREALDNYVNERYADGKTGTEEDEEGEE